MPAVSVIGLDGVNWTILEEAIEKGKMPNFEKILRDSYNAELETTYPSVTGPAWTSIVTGVNPARHGVFDFIDHVGGGKPYSSRDIKKETIFEQISRKGDVSVVNLPLSYPPRFEGEFVGSFLAPDDDFYRPEGLGDRFDFEEYKARLSAVEKSLSVISSSSETAESKRSLAETLIGDQDLFFMLFSAPDWVMHNRYHEMEYGDCEACFDLFSTIDDTIGLAAERSEDLIILSDHGFKTYKEVFHVNQWLKENGYLETEGSMESQWLDNRLIELVFQAIGRSQRVKRVFRSSYLSLEDRLPLPENVKVRVSSLLSEGVKREVSDAFCPSTELAGIYINDGRFDGRVEEKEQLVRDILESLPERVKAVQGKEVYQGKYLEEAPDIIFLEENVYVSRGVYGEIFSDREVNHHARNGFLVASGSHVKESAEKKNHDLYDVAPTIAKFFDLDIDSDGEALPVTAFRRLESIMPDDY